MMEVPIKTAPSFEAGTPRVVFRRALKEGIYESLSYDVSADGQRFLMIERDLEAAPNQVNIVLDCSPGADCVPGVGKLLGKYSLQAAVGSEQAVAHYQGLKPVLDHVAVGAEVVVGFFLLSFTGYRKSERESKTHGQETSHSKPAWFVI